MADNGEEPTDFGEADGKKITGTIQIAFHEDGSSRWRGMGKFNHAVAVNMCEMIKAFYIQQQMEALLRGAFQQAQRQIVPADATALKKLH